MYYFVLRAGPATKLVASGRYEASRHWVAGVKSEKKVDPFFTDDLRHEPHYELKRAKKIVRWALVNMGKLNKQRANELVENGYWPDESVDYSELCVKLYTMLSRNSRRKGTSLVRCLACAHGVITVTDRSWQHGD